jgi:hypothetical protein
MSSLWYHSEVIVRRPSVWLSKPSSYSVLRTLSVTLTPNKNVIYLLMQYFSVPLYQSLVRSVCKWHLPIMSFLFKPHGGWDIFLLDETWDGMKLTLPVSYIEAENTRKQCTHHKLTDDRTSHARKERSSTLAVFPQFPGFGFRFVHPNYLISLNAKLCWSQRVQRKTNARATCTFDSDPCDCCFLARLVHENWSARLHW